MPPLCGVKRFAGGKTLQRLCRCHKTVPCGRLRPQGGKDKLVAKAK